MTRSEMCPKLSRMIVLHQFAPAFGLPNASPFCMKVETWLRMAGLAYETENSGNVFKAPKGKLPWIDDGATVVADSSAIVEHLTRSRGIALDAAHTPRQAAEALAWQRLFEEHLYWAMVHVRWIDDAGWPKTREAFFGGLPAPVRAVIAPMARRSMRRELHGQGMGRHAPGEILALGVRDVEAVAEHLGDQPFMLGEAPCSLDAVAYAFLANLLWAPFESSLLEAARRRPALEAYCRRMQARYF